MRGIEFEHHIRNLILELSNRGEKMKRMRTVYERACLTAARPTEAILQEFVDHGKRYKEEDLVETAAYLGKAYQMSLLDNGGVLDRFDYKLYESPMWDNFMEEVKYALSEKAYIQEGNIVRLLDALGELRYVDKEVIRLVMQRIERILELPK
jgi:hypothetical protein